MEKGKIYMHEGAVQSSTQALTDPPLYSIFGGRNIVFSENQDEDSNLYNNLNKLKENKVGNQTTNTQNTYTTAYSTITFNNFFKTLLFGVIIFFLFNNIHENNPNIIPAFTTHFLNFIVSHESTKGLLSIFLLNSLLLDISILIIGLFLNNYTHLKNNKTNRSSFVQLIVALIGIVYCFKKLSWNSTYQADLLFILVNAIFVKYTDCSVTESLTGMIIFSSSLLYDSLFNDIKSLDINLWRACFMFLTSIVLMKSKKTNHLF